MMISSVFSVEITVLSLCVCAKSLQSCLTLCNPKDHTPSSSSVHGILQARILEWIAVPSSGGSSQSRDRTCVSYVSCIGRWVLYHQCHLAMPILFLIWINVYPFSSLDYLSCFQFLMITNEATIKYLHINFCVNISPG